MKITKKRAVLGIAGALASVAAVVPAPASASCHEVIEGQCIEQVVCAAGRVVNDNLNCIQ